MKSLGRWLAETRMGRAVFRATMVGFIALAAAILIWVEVHRQTDPIVQRIAVIERVEPADVLRECLRDRECRQLIRSVRERLERTERGDASQPAPAGQQPEPGVRPGGREGRGQRPGGGRRTDRPSRPNAPSVPDQSPAPTAPTAPQPVPSPPPPPPSPGKSGETPGAGKGTRACLDLIVSACAEGPRLLP